MSHRLSLKFDSTGQLNAALLPRPLYLRVGIPRRRSHRVGIPPRRNITLRERAAVSVQLQDDQEVDLAVEARDGAGNVVPNPGQLTWSVDKSDVLVLTTDPNDQAKAVITTTGALGVATVTVTDDLDGDPSTAEAVGSLSVEVVTGPVTQIVVTAGEPRKRPTS